MIAEAVHAASTSLGGTVPSGPSHDPVKNSLTLARPAPGQKTLPDASSFPGVHAGVLSP